MAEGQADIPVDVIDPKLRKLVENVQACINDDDFSKLRSLLKPCVKQVRKNVVTVPDKLGNPPLFSCCWKGKLHIVNYLLDECNADIEQRGVYQVEEDNSKHSVTALWCASVANKIEVVETLIKHGAVIDSPSDTMSTPVRSACYMTNLEIVKYLVENGADISKPNISGGTCLINSVQSPELCEYLICAGADVNASDHAGNLALHYAVREGRPETVKFLLKYNSNYSMKNDMFDDALQTAALRGHLDIMEYIIENTEQSPIDIIHAYELLGANLVDEKHDFTAARKAWKKAMELRYRDPENLLLKKLPVTTNDVYLNMREPETLKDLLASMADPTSVYMQALLIRERILGTAHKDTTFALMYRGAVYADSLHYQRSLDLWKYSFMLRHQKPSSVTHECFFTCQALVKLLWEMYMDSELGSTSEKVNPTDVIDVLRTLCEEIKQGVPHSVRDQQDRKMQYHYMLCLALHLVHLLCKIDMTATQSSEFKSICYKLVKSDARGNNNASLLHLAVDARTSKITDEYYSEFPSKNVIEVLIYHGCDINSCDYTGNSPLLTTVMYGRYRTAGALSSSDVFDLLLEHGAHVDMCNMYGETIFDHLRLAESNHMTIEHMTLKCFAANVIVKYDIPYINEIPASLISFVKMHTSKKPPPAPQ